MSSNPTSPGAPAVSAPAVPLTSVAAGGLATLHEVRDPQARALLRSLGLTSACHLRMCKIGDPCIVQVRATRIGLSRAVAHCVYVLPDPAGDR
jgi:Fe2+ transport system protein FeoA